MPELVLDSQVRFWVFIPIVIITFLFGLARHYASLLMTSQKKGNVQQLGDAHYITRSHFLRENGKYLPKASFDSRRRFLADRTSGFFRTETREPPMRMAMDSSSMSDMMKGNLTNVMPMILLGGWINWAFSGFLTTKVPFPLTFRFKDMLQRGIMLSSLDASWVSSVSWYFINVFGLRSVYSLVLGRQVAGDETFRLMQDEVATGPAGQDMNAAFKAEADALEMTQHDFFLEKRYGSGSLSSNQQAEFLCKIKHPLTVK